MGLQEMGWGVMDCVDLARDRERLWAVVTAVMNLQVSQNAREFLA
jgi:hypothetical protein